MNWVALKMLMGDRAKYLSLIFGVAFATLLMTQQVSIFMGILTRTGNQILDVNDADIWVMDRHVRFLDEARPIRDGQLERVRGVAGVAWAVPLHKGQVLSRLENGETRNVYLTGVDDTSLAGAPTKLLAGNLLDLRQPGAVIIDKAGYEYMWGTEPYQLGREFHINDRRVVLVGVCEVGSPFFSVPIIYSRFLEAARIMAPRAKATTFVLAKTAAGQPVETVRKNIEAATGLTALSRDQFFWKTVWYFIGSTGIPINFGVTIALGFIVGAAVTGQTLYLFIIENLRQFGVLKAMGLRNSRILLMILLQSCVVGGLGFCIGLGMTAMFFIATSGITALAGIHMTWHALALTSAAICVITLGTSLFSARKVLVLEPAVVFRG
ncbi:MAG: FtsX-like permease family protein [Pirellulales bacterium]|nr:FtsX-like permease family protein [Pirellulales bacterium]